MSPRDSVLDSIVARTRERIRAGAYTPGPGKEAAPEGARFADALRGPGTRIIAEIKKQSPSAGEILPHAERKIETFALAYRRGHAAAISVVTEPEFFGGDAGWVERARRISGLPVLMKDFIVEESQLDYAAACGADAVLLIAAILDGGALDRLIAGAAARGLAAIAEVHGEAEIPRALDAGAGIVGVNARDLKTFSVDLELPCRMAARIPDPIIRVAESGIQSRAQVERLASCGFQAFLVGETLLRSEEPEVALRELRGRP